MRHIMRFQVRERVFSFGDNFTIRDQNNSDIYQVIGQVFSFGDKLSLCDMNQNELFYIEQKLLRFFPEYELYQNGSVVATCKKEFSLFGSKFNIESSNGLYEIHGAPFNYNYEITKNGNLVATVDKEFFSFSDTYGVDISDSEDSAFILSLVIIIDQVVHDDKKH